MQQLQDFVKNARSLPAPPSDVAKIVRIIDSGDPSIDQVVAIFQSNPTMSARLLKLANSAFYGLRQRVTTVHRATVLLGLKTIRSLAVTIWTHSIASKYKIPPIPQRLDRLFKHSAACSVVAQEVALRVRKDLSDNAFLAGLLHDIGRVALMCDQGKAYDALIQSEPDDRDVFLERETERYGFHHAELGGYLAQEWGFPDFLARAATHHHATDASTADPLLWIIYAADIICNDYFMNVADGIRRQVVDGHLRTRLKLEDDLEMEAFIGRCNERFNDFIATVS